MYISPAVTRYSRDELHELVGPVETQYCEVTDVTATPDQIIQSKTDITISFSFAPCVNFTNADITLIDSSDVRLTSDSFNRAQGRESGTIWTLPVYDFRIVLDPGDYLVEVILTDSDGNTSEPQYASFTVL